MAGALVHQSDLPLGVCGPRSEEADREEGHDDGCGGAGHHVDGAVLKCHCVFALEVTFTFPGMVHLGDDHIALFNSGIYPILYVELAADLRGTLE